MSEPIPPGEGGGGGFMSARIFGMPAIVVLGGVAVLAYFLFFRNSSGGATSSGGGGTATTGNINFHPGADTITVNYQGPKTTTAQYNNNSTVTHRPPPRHKTPNPQPRPKPPPKKKKVVQHVKKPASDNDFVTVAKWTEGNTPWNSTLSGIAAHEHVSLGTLLKLNPQIKNPNLIYPGQKIRFES